MATQAPSYGAAPDAARPGPRRLRSLRGAPPRSHPHTHTHALPPPATPTRSGPGERPPRPVAFALRSAPPRSAPLPPVPVPVHAPAPPLPPGRGPLTRARARTPPSWQTPPPSPTSPPPDWLSASPRRPIGEEGGTRGKGRRCARGFWRMRRAPLAPPRPAWGLPAACPRPARGLPSPAPGKGPPRGRKGPLRLLGRPAPLVPSSGTATRVRPWERRGGAQVGLPSRGPPGRAVGAPGSGPGGQNHGIIES